MCEYMYGVCEGVAHLGVHLRHHTRRGSIFSKHGKNIGSNLRGHNNGIVLSHWVRKVSSGEDLRENTWTMSRHSGASGNSCVNRHNAKSMSSIAVPEVIPRISKLSPGCFCSADGDGELAVSEESPLAFDCNASRYLCPTGVRTRPFGAGMRPFMTVTIAHCQQVERRIGSLIWILRNQ